MSASYRFSSSDATAAEARSLAGTKVGDFRIKETTEASKVSIEQLQSQCEDYYARLVAEVKRGERKPIKLRNWNSVVNSSHRFLIDRIPHNFKMFKASKGGDGAKIALIPTSFSAPHPTIEEREAYMARWEMDGDLYQQAMAECRKYNADDRIAFYPTIIHALHPKSLLMVCVAIMVVPASI